MKTVLRAKSYEIIFSMFVVQLLSNQCFQSATICPNGVETLVSLVNNTVFTVFNPSNKIHKIPTYEIPGEQRFQVKCLSNSPTRLEFDGIMFTRIENTDSSRKMLDLQNASKYCYEVQVTLISKRETTGRYSCISKKISSVYIFTSGNKSPHLLHSQSGQNELSATISNNRLIIPCVTTNSSIPIKLLMDEKDVTNDLRVKYDPTIGFVLEHTFSNSSYFYNKTFTCMEVESSINGSIHVVHSRIVSLSDLAKNKNIVFKQPENWNHTNAGICFGATSIAIINCNTTLECQFAKSCATFHEQTNCGYKRDECSSNSTSYFCKVKLPENFNGVVFCKRSTTVNRIFFFTNLCMELVFSDNSVTNHDNEFVIKNKLIALEYDRDPWEKVDEFSFGGEKSIKCKVSKWVASEGIQILIEYKNGSRVQPNATYEQAESDALKYTKLSEMVFEDTQIAKLICLVPKFNSLEWFEISKRIRVLGPHPVLKLIKWDDNFEDLKKPCNLSCTAISIIGDPNQIQLSWAIGIGPNKHKVDHRQSQYSNNWTTSTLIFDEGMINSLILNREAIYSCNASNPSALGEKSVFHYFKLIYEDGIVNVLHFLEEPTPSSQSVYTLEKVLVIISLCIVIICCLAGILYFCLKKAIVHHRMQKNRLDFTAVYNGKTVQLKNVHAQEDENDENSSLVEVSLLHCKDNLISPSDLKMGKILQGTQGNYGLVMAAIYKKKGKVEEKVAVKMLHPQKVITKQIYQEFLKEINLWQYEIGPIGHPNVVRYIGSVANQHSIEKFKPKIVLEFCPLNDLKSYLTNSAQSISEIETFIPGTNQAENTSAYRQIKTTNQIDTKDLLQWSHDIACGMEFLMERKILHRDLSARNVLLDANKVAKINDFGLSRCIMYKVDKSYYVPAEPTKQSPIPLRWLSPEVLRSFRYSEASDVWAYGITLFEIFSIGEDPYSDILNLENEQISQIMNFLTVENKRLEKPERASNAMYKIMMACWDAEPSKRPRFITLKESVRLENCKNEIQDSASSVNETDSDSENDSESENGETNSDGLSS